MSLIYNFFNDTNPSPQVQNDQILSNLSIRCDPRTIGPSDTFLNMKSRAGKVGVEDNICDLDVANLSVAELKINAELTTGKINASSLSGGTANSEYIFFNNSTGKFEIGSTEVHIGKNAGLPTGNPAGIQGDNAIAVGFSAGISNQGKESIAIGRGAGGNGGGGPQTGEAQQEFAIAIGTGAGTLKQGKESIAIGHNTASFKQGEESIAIGRGAGSSTPNNTIGANSIIIGDFNSQPTPNPVGPNSLTLNSTGLDIFFNNSPQANELRIATLPLGLATATTGGLKSITITSTYPVPPPLGSGNFNIPQQSFDPFSHYLVYDPLTGEIRLCPLV